MTQKGQQDTWHDMLRGGLAYRALDGREERWRRYIRLMAHKWTDEETPLIEDSPTVNMLAARARSIAPKLAMGMPEWGAKSVFAPPNPNSESGLSTILQLFWRTEQMASEMKRITDDFALFGPGVGFVGYEATYDKKVLDRSRSLFGVIPVVPGSLVEKVADAMPNFTPEQVESVRMLMSQRAFLRRVSPLNYVPDPTAEHDSLCAFKARRLFLTTSEAEALLGKKAPEPTSVANVALYDSVDPLDPFGSQESLTLETYIPETIRRVVVWELWDMDSRRTVYMNEMGDHLADFEWKSAHPGFPLLTMDWDDVPDNVYSEGLGAAIEPQNRELHLIRSGLLSTIAGGKRKYRYSADLSKDAMDATRSDEDGAMVPLEDGQFVEPMQFSGLPPETFEAEQRVRDTIDEVTNMSAYDTGQAIPGKRTATESAFIQSTSDAVTSYRQQQVEQFVAQVGERMLAIVVSVYDKPIPIQIVNRDENLMILDTNQKGEEYARRAEVGEKIEYDFVGVDHAGAYVVSIEPGSLVAAAKDMERANLFSAFDRFNPFPWFDARAFASQILSSMPGIRNAGDFILGDEEAAERAKVMQELQQSMQPPEQQGGQQPPQGGMPGNVDPSQAGMQTPDMMGSTVLPEQGYGGVGEEYAAFYGANAPNVPR